MKQKAQRISITDRRVKKLFKKGEQAATEKDFFELLKRAVKPQK